MTLDALTQTPDQLRALAAERTATRTGGSTVATITRSTPGTWGDTATPSGHDTARIDAERASTRASHRRARSAALTRETRQAPHAPTEHDEQCRLIAWAEEMTGRYPALELVYAVPNGGYRSRRTAGRMKSEGLKAGVPDLHIPVARGPYIGLWIELKRERGGRLSAAQSWWIDRLTKAGHCVYVCAGAEAAQAAILEYLTITPTGA